MSTFAGDVPVGAAGQRIWSAIAGGIIAGKHVRRVVTMAQSAAKKNSKAKAPAKKAPVKKAPAKKAPVKKAPAKKAPAKKAPAKKAPVKKAPAKKAPVKKAPVKKAPVKKAPATKAASTSSSVPTAPIKKLPDKKVATAKDAVAKKAPAPPAKKAKPVFVKPPVPGKKAPSKDGIIANRDFDLTYLRAQRALLLQERAHLLGQAERLDTERERLIEEAGMGDDQFDEDGGEGDTMAVERERDRVLSDQARQTVEDIDAALARIESGDYGYSVISTKPIPRERLEVIPWATELVEERVGWIGRR